MNKLKLSILDLAKFTEETKTASEVLNQSTELADKPGYTRYWFAEHHNTSMIMSMFPEIHMLGSSTGGVEFALTKGLPFVFAAQINADLAVSALTMYRRRFKPSEYLQEPLFYTGRW